MSKYAVNGKEPVHAWIPSLDTVGNGTTTLTDLAGSNNGTLTNMDAATDWVSDTNAGGVRALDFDGVNDYVVAPSINCASISISLWARFTSDVSQVFIAKRSNTSYAWEIGRNASDDRMLVRINDNANFATGGNLLNNIWYHLVGTYDGASIKAYLNGVLVGTTAYATAITISSVQTTIGARALFPGAESFFPLRLDDVRIFDQAIALSDVQYLYSGGLGRGITAGSGIIPILRQHYAAQGAR